MEKIFSKCGHTINNLKEVKRYIISNKNSGVTLKGPNADEHHLVVYCGACKEEYDVIKASFAFQGTDGKSKSLSEIL